MPSDAYEEQQDMKAISSTEEVGGAVGNDHDDDDGNELVEARC